MLVNVYGTKDILTRVQDILPLPVAIAGYRESWGGFVAGDLEKPLFNIEIEGAGHFDYIRGVDDYSSISDPEERKAAETRNKLVSNFVAQLSLHCDDAEAMRKFLDENSYAQRDPNREYTWIISIPGVV